MYVHTHVQRVTLHNHTAGPMRNGYPGVTNTHVWAIAYIFWFKRAYKYFFIYIYIYTHTYCVMQWLPFSLQEQLV